MPLLTAREFLERLERDSRFQKKFALAAPDNLDAILEFAAQQGYQFDEEDFTVALQAFPKSRLAHDYAGPRLRLKPNEPWPHH